MKNLKRILSLALAGTMLAGMMVVGASAASFKDDDIITKNTAVDTMATLGVISGKEDGNFDPKGDVTRAEMATMIAIALHGGEKDFRGTTNAGFTDTVNHWAAKYIKYCVDQGILSGRGDGTFDPNSNVTAQEAIVMMLLAMGYRKEIFANVGGDWAAKYNDKAEKLGLYDDTDVIDYTATVNRENAAQIIYNGINCKTPVINDTYNVVSGEHTYTVVSEDAPELLSTKFGVNIEYAIITSTTVNENGTYTYTVDTTGIKVDPYQGESITAKIDVSDLYLQKVRVIYSGNQVLGITSIVDGILSEGVVGSMKVDEKKHTLDGKKVEGGKEDEIPTYAFNGTETLDETKAYWNYSLVDSDGNGAVDAIVVYPFTVEAVTGVGKTTATIGGKSYKLKEIDVDGTLTKGDYVKHTTAIDGTDTFETIEILEDRVASVKDSKGNYTIGGAKYGEGETGALAAVDTLGASYDLVVVNGYAFDSWKHQGSTTAAGVDKVVYATRVNDPTAPTDEFGEVTTKDQTQRVELLFNDNSKQAVTVTKVDGKKVENGKVAADEKTFYTYSIDGDGNYQLTTMTVTDGSWNGLAEADVAGYTVKDGKATKAGATTYRFSDNAVIFAMGSKGIKVYTGAEIAKWSKNGTALTTGKLYTAPNASGFLYTSLGIVTVEGAEWPDAVPSTSGDKFGYLTADTVKVFDSAQGKEFARLTVWTGEEEVTYLAADTELDITKYPAGTMLRYKVNNKDQLEVVEEFAPVAKAVTAYDGANTIQFKDSAEYSLKDAIIIYIDANEKTGVEEGSIQLATDDPDSESTELLNNVWVVTNDEDMKVTVMFVDVANGLQ